MRFLEDLFGDKGRTVVITGEEGVIAGAISTAFLKARKKISLQDRSMDSLEANKKMLIKNLGVSDDFIQLVEADCTIEADIEVGYGKTCIALGIPSVLVNGVVGNKEKHPLNEQDLEPFMDILKRTLVEDLLLPSQIFTKAWQKEGEKGCTLNIAPMSSYNGLSGVWAYNASKTAVMNLAVGIAREFTPYGIRGNSISSGFLTGKKNHDLLIEQDDPLILTDREKKYLNGDSSAQIGEF